MLAGEFRLVIDFRPDYPEGIMEILKRNIRWGNVGECYAIIPRGYNSEILKILCSCGCVAGVFDGYSSLSGIFTPPCITVSNDVVFEQIIADGVSVYSGTAGFFMKKNLEYKAMKYGKLKRSNMLKAISAFKYFPELPQMRIISRIKKPHLKNKGRIGVFWNREAGRRAASDIEIKTGPGRILPSFDGGRFLLKIKQFNL